MMSYSYSLVSARLSHLFWVLVHVLENERILLLKDEDDLRSEGGGKSVGGGLEQMVHDVVELPEQNLVLLHIPQQPILVFHSEVLGLAAI
jgi:hypothetical protein